PGRGPRPSPGSICPSASPCRRSVPLSQDLFATEGAGALVADGRDASTACGRGGHAATWRHREAIGAREAAGDAAPGAERTRAGEPGFAHAAREGGILP